MSLNPMDRQEKFPVALIPYFFCLYGEYPLKIKFCHYFYISKGNHNEDIEDFRGFSDLILRYGKEERRVINLLLRHSLKGKYTFQLDFSYPIRNKIFSLAGVIFILKVFKVYFSF